MKLITEKKFTNSTFEGKKGIYHIKLVEQDNKYKVVLSRYSSGIAWDELRSITKDKINDAEDLFDFFVRQLDN